MSAKVNIATVTLNPAIDQTIRIDNFVAGGVNRVLGEQSDAGGKGVNVASFLSHFGHKVAVTGLLGARNPAIFERLFHDCGIVNRFVMAHGSTRINVKIVDTIQNRVTDVNFPGLSVSSYDVDGVFAAIDDLCAEGVGSFLFAGSLPAGTSTGLYAEIVAHLKAMGKRVVLDTSGPALKEAVLKGPDIIKPNLHEFNELTGNALTKPKDIVRVARELSDSSNVPLVVVSLGERGALFVTSEEALWARPPKVDVSTTVGAGDAMVAGLMHCLQLDLSLSDMARQSTACSVGALTEVGPLLPDVSVIDALAQKVKIEPVEL
ncbi:1-phosphofructokinase [Cohaesibacter sp. ES.047]|uniref:1-phosphofructokinase n=1 Tax=Cohaesibacter sp. ES.047 TaxID=1798205 RepID=UPI000BB7769F|nr:1-phosphofructokinase [Cohaesibacter sp. ES.047]SNY90734.1 1-phosphofructokinase [Cohaesibacter sp. ES.047]